MMKYTNRSVWKWLLLPCLVLIFFTACQKEEEQLEAPFELGEIVNMHNDELAHSFGKLLAISVKNTDVKSFVKNEVIQQFDGDYDMLLTMNMDKQAENVQGRSTTFRSMLKNAIPNGRTESIDALIDQIQSEYPLLQISVPELDVMSAEDWDIENHTPIVAILDHDYDDQTTATVTAYDADGNAFQLNALNQPDQLVIVVGPSERVVAISNPGSDPNGRTEGLIDPPICQHELLALPPIYTTEEYILYNRGEYMDALSLCIGGGGGTGGGDGDGDGDGGTGTGGTGTGGTGTGGTGTGTGGDNGTSATTCDRDRVNNKIDFIHKARFKDKGVLDGVEGAFLNGKPEVRLYVVFARNPSNPVFTQTSKDIGEEGWHHRNWGKLVLDTKIINSPFFEWKDEIYGDRVRYVWIEEDPYINQKTINVDIMSTFHALNDEITNVVAHGTASFSVGNKDKIICETYLGYCHNTDGEGHKYSDSMIFWVNQQLE